MTPTFAIENIRLFLADSMEALPHVGLVESIVTDPPYGLSFMGKRWDYDVPTVDLWTLALECLRPGGHLLAFAGTRTQHRMAVRIEDAGFEIRDLIAWVYGSGFPKSLDVSKAIDDAAGAVREKGEPSVYADGHVQSNSGTATSGYSGGLTSEGEGVRRITIPATDSARQWSGWGTALKPALEPITVARRPLEGTVAENVLAHGTGVLNVDGCRVHRASDDESGWSVSGSKASENRAMSGGNYDRDPKPDASGRWPANLIHDGSEEVVGLFPKTASGKPMNRMHTDPGRCVASGASGGGTYMHTGFGDSGSAARFFYESKATRNDRNEGCEAFFWYEPPVAKRWLRIDEATYRRLEAENVELRKAKKTTHKIAQGNIHPTVKPTDLMGYLMRLVTRPGGIVLDPFMGSGSTGKAAVLEGFGFVGIERDPDHFEIAKARILDAIRQRDEARRLASAQLEMFT
jgi:site-specific DNA-methyltransferase (adenine-specific)